MEIREIREKLNSIDAEMAQLFEKRMEAVRELAEYRGERGLAVEDREEELGQRLTPVLEKLGLSALIEADADAVFEAMLSDKKMKGGQIAAVYADIPGESYIRMTSPEELRERIGRTVR